MKILYTSDLHGHENFYQEILRYVKNESIDVLILGGDLLPKRGHFTESLHIQKDFVKNKIRQYFIQLKKETNASIYLILGNDDWSATIPLFKKLEAENLLHLIHDKTYNITEELLIVGYPYVPPTPFSSKDFEKYDRRGDPLQSSHNLPAVSTQNLIQRVDEVRLFSQRTSIQEDMNTLPRPNTHQKAIYVMHAPPFETSLDLLHNGKPVGSRAILEFIQKEQPFMTLHGHIHESPAVSGIYWKRIGKTLSMNPGQPGKRLSAVIFDINQPTETLTHTLYGVSSLTQTSYQP